MFKQNIVAEGGGFDNENPDLDYQLDHDDDDEQEVDTTHPFQSGSASTPYHGGEHIEMQTIQHEHSGLPDTSYEGTSLLGPQSESEKSWTTLTNLFPKASATNLETYYSGGRLQVKIAGFVLDIKISKFKFRQEEVSGEASGWFNWARTTIEF